MSFYLARLKALDADQTLILPRFELPKLPEDAALILPNPFGSFGSRHQEDNKLIGCDINLISNWWLVTSEGLQPIEVAIYPPCTKSEAMALNKNASYIEAMPSPILKAGPINTARELLDAMLECGYLIHLDTDDDLVVYQRHWVDDELTDLITIHKIELIKILKSEY